MAMEDSSYEYNYYLDLKTGKVLMISENMDDEEIEKLTDEIDENPDRYERIPRAEPHDAYEDMDDFIATVEDKHLVELLEVAIDGKGAFRRFKDVLVRYPEERERWFRSKDEMMEAKASEWLNDIGIRLVKG